MHASRLRGVLWVTDKLFLDIAGVLNFFYLSGTYETYPGKEVGVSLYLETQSMSGEIPALKTVHKHT